MPGQDCKTALCTRGWRPGIGVRALLALAVGMHTASLASGLLSGSSGCPPWLLEAPRMESPGLDEPLSTNNIVFYADYKSFLESILETPEAFDDSGGALAQQIGRDLVGQ